MSSTNLVELFDRTERREHVRNPLVFHIVWQATDKYPTRSACSVGSKVSSLATLQNPTIRCLEPLAATRATHTRKYEQNRPLQQKLLLAFPSTAVCVT